MQKEREERGRRKGRGRKGSKNTPPPMLPAPLDVQRTVNLAEPSCQHCGSAEQCSALGSLPTQSDHVNDIAVTRKTCCRNYSTDFSVLIIHNDYLILKCVS